MENTPWKPILIAAAASLMLLILVYVFILPKKAAFDEGAVERIAEFESTRVAGHKEGKKVWEFYAKKGWMDRNRNTTYLRDVTKGTLYKDGDLIVKELSAPRVKAFRRTEVVEAYSQTGDKDPLRAVIAFTPKKDKEKRKFAALRADSLVYDPQKEQSQVKGDIKVSEEEVTLYSKNMLLDHKNEVADLSDDIRIIRSDIDLTCNKLHYDSNFEELKASGSVKAKIDGSPEAKVISDEMDLFVDDQKDVIIRGGLSITQGKKASVAEKAVYNKAEGRLTLTGKVNSIIEKGEALLKEDTARKLRSKDAKDLLSEKTLLSSDKLIMYTESGNADALGNVLVTQKGREAKAQRADYSEKEEIIVLSGEVFMKKEKQWISCQSVKVSVKDEAFEASGEVESEFKIKR